MIALRLMVFAVVLTLLGCATAEDSAVFVTRTSLGLDVDSAPATAAIGYNRVEGYLGPRYDTGTVPAVAGSFHTDGGLFNRKVRQTYATGNAALNATNAGTGNPAPEAEHFSGPRKAMFFGTGTVLGINMGFGDAGASSFTFGFKRKELSVIPVSSTVTSVVTAGSTATQVVHTFPSVFARIDNTAEAGTPSNSSLDIAQFFATGIAAQRLANNPEVQSEFRKEAIDLKLAYRDEEHKQSRMGFDALYCVSRLADADLPTALSNAQALGLFSAQDLTDLKAAPTAHAKRAVYTGRIGLMNPNDREATTLIELHKKFVCDLPGVKS